MRYVLAALALIYFSTVSGVWLDGLAVRVGLFAYLLLNTVSLVWVLKTPYRVHHHRLAMVLDAGIVALCLANDPAAAPPTVLGFVVVSLGNGLRFGMRLFREALVACLAAAIVGVAARHGIPGGPPSSPGAVFLYVVAGIIVLYTYLLMSRIEASHQELLLHSRRDALTGLFNRRHLLDVADEMFDEVAAGRMHLVVMFADMDRFKEINDRWGHAVGDRVLRAVGGLIERTVRSSDPVARYGGDEFVILFPDTSVEDARQAGRRVREAVARWAEREGLPCSITLGLGEAPMHGTSLKEVLEQVDRALYASKANSARGGIMLVGELEPIPA